MKLKWTIDDFVPLWRDNNLGGGNWLGDETNERNLIHIPRTHLFFFYRDIFLVFQTHSTWQSLFYLLGDGEKAEEEVGRFLPLNWVSRRRTERISYYLLPLRFISMFLGGKKWIERERAREGGRGGGEKNCNFKGGSNWSFSETNDAFIALLVIRPRLRPHILSSFTPPPLANKKQHGGFIRISIAGEEIPHNFSFPGTRIKINISFSPLKFLPYYR